MSIRIFWFGLVSTQFTKGSIHLDKNNHQYYRHANEFLMFIYRL